MEVAIHLKNISKNREVIDLADHLASFYDDGAIDREAFGEVFQSISRYYIGDEFCPMRLPGPNALNDYCRYSQTNNVPLTLLVPVLTDAWIDRCSAMFACLESWYPHAEVVVNDLGTLFFLKKKHGGFRISLGRIVNKGFKDPRLSMSDRYPTPTMTNLLNESTFDNPVFQTLLARLSVDRLERDLMPHGNLIGGHEDDRQTSYYFPFGYVTTGRGCLTATFSQAQTNGLWPHTKCSKPCDTLSLELKNDKHPARLIQAGNTVFYLYSPQKLSALIKAAGQANHRLVYQGFVL